MSDSVWPHRWHPTSLPRPWDSPGKNTGVGCHFLLQCVKVKSLSRVRLFATQWTVAYQPPPSMGFFRQEYWSGLPLPSPTCMLSCFNCVWLCVPMNYNPPGSYIHGILLARILEWVGISSSRGIFLTRRSNLRLLSLLQAGSLFTTSTTSFQLLQE